MKKKLFASLMTLVMAVSVAACGGASDAPADSASGELEPVNITFGTVMTSTEYCTQILESWMDEVEAMSDGKITFSYHVGGALGTTVEHIEQTEMGAMDMSMHELASLEPWVSEIGVMYNPFMVDSYEHQMAIIDGEAGDFIRDKFVEKTNMTVVGWYPSGQRNTISVRPIETLEDAKGMIIRVPEAQIYAETFKLLGMSPTPLAYADAYSGLQTGVVEAMECPLPALYDGGYSAVAPNLCMTGHMFGNAIITANSDFWNGLPEEYRTIMIDAFNKLIGDHNQGVFDMDAELIEAFKADGVPVTEITDIDDLSDELNAFYDSFVEKVGDSGKEFKALIDACR